jgi:hypothetical protein
MLFFAAHRLGIDRGGAELCVAEPALEHVEGNALYCGMNTEPMPETLRAAMRRIRDTRFDHDPFHDLPDPDPGQVPDRGGRLPAGFLRLPYPVGGG